MINFKKAHNAYLVEFYNPISNLIEYVGMFEKEEEAISEYRKKEFEFYSHYPYLLPKYITLNKKINTFQFSFTYKNKNFYIGLFKTLEEAKNEKIKFITNFLQ